MTWNYEYGVQYRRKHKKRIATIKKAQYSKKRKDILCRQRKKRRTKIGRITTIYCGQNQRMGTSYSLNQLTEWVVKQKKYHIMWKKWNNSKKIYLFHFIAFSISILSITSRNIGIYLILNIFLFIFVAFIVYTAYKNSEKKKQSLYVIYILLFIFWILNIIDILIPSFLQTFQLFIYLISSGIFLLILYKVLKKTG